MCACAISAECAVRRGNFEIAKEPELISQKGRLYSKSRCTTVISIRSGLQLYVLWHIKKMVLYSLNHMAFVSSLSTMLAVYSHDGAGPCNQHFFYLRQILEA